jgi:hypothetical protein
MRIHADDHDDLDWHDDVYAGPRIDHDYIDDGTLDEFLHANRRSYYYGRNVVNVTINASGAASADPVT